LPSALALLANALLAVTPAPAAKGDGSASADPGENTFADLADAAANDTDAGSEPTGKSAKPAKTDKAGMVEASKAAHAATPGSTTGAQDDTPVEELPAAAAAALQSPKIANAGTARTSDPAPGETDEPNEEASGPSQNLVATAPGVPVVTAAAPAPPEPQPAKVPRDETPAGKIDAAVCSTNGESPVTPSAHDAGTAGPEKAAPPASEHAAALPADKPAQSVSTAAPSEAKAPPGSSQPAQAKAVAEPVAVATALPPKPAQRTIAADALGNVAPDAKAQLSKTVADAATETSADDRADALQTVAGHREARADAVKDTGANASLDGSKAAAQKAGEQSADARGAATAKTDNPAPSGAGALSTGKPALPDVSTLQTAQGQTIATADATGVHSLHPGHNQSTSSTPIVSVRAHVQGGQVHLPVEQIAIAITRQARQGANRFEIRLDPPELGRIDVRLDVGSDGRATASLTADRQDTLDLLSRDSRTLQKTLADAGFTTDPDALQFSLRDGNQGQGRGRFGTPDAPVTDPVAADAIAPISDNPQITASLGPGRLDLRV